MVLYYVTTKPIQHKHAVLALLKICSGASGERQIVQLLTNKYVLAKESKVQARIKQIIALKFSIIGSLNIALAQLGLEVYNADMIDYFMQKSKSLQSLKSIINKQKKIIVDYYNVLCSNVPEQVKSLLGSIIKHSLIIKSALEELKIR